MNNLTQTALQRVSLVFKFGFVKKCRVCFLLICGVFYLNGCGIYSISKVADISCNNIKEVKVEKNTEIKHSQPLTEKAVKGAIVDKLNERCLDFEQIKDWEKPYSIAIKYFSDARFSDTSLQSVVDRSRDVKRIIFDFTLSSNDNKHSRSVNNIVSDMETKTNDVESIISTFISDQKKVKGALDREWKFIMTKLLQDE